jgi:hypothetical protein
VRDRLQILVLLAAVAAGGCGEGPRSEPAPLDRFTFPTGLALAPLAGGGRALVVVSSNFDLRYGQADGGSVLAVDPDASGLAENGVDLAPERLVVLGAARIASFAGEAAVASGAALPAPAGAPANPPTCAGSAATEVLVPARTDNALFRVAMDGAGALACGEGCRVPLPPNVGDPYAVQVVCRPGGERSAYVSHLRAPDAFGWISRVDLAAGAATLLRAGDAPTGGFAYDLARQRLYVTGRFARLDQAPLRWLELLTGATQTANLAPEILGADLRSIALSSDGTRAFVTVRLIDRDLATDLSRPVERAGALAVVDLTTAAAGAPAATLLRLVPVALGPDQLVVLPRLDGRRDLVVISSSGEGAVTIYDDETSSVAATLATDERGERIFGRQPFGLAAERIDGTRHRVYVGSFDRGFVRTMTVDADAPALAAPGRQFGPEMP